MVWTAPALSHFRELSQLSTAQSNITHPGNATKQFVYGKLDLAAGKPRDDRWFQRFNNTLRQSAEWKLGWARKNRTKRHGSAGASPSKQRKNQGRGTKTTAEGGYLPMEGEAPAEPWF